MSQSTHAPIESGFASGRPLLDDSSRIIAGLAVVVMFVIAVLALVTFDHSASGWFALLVAVLCILASARLVANDSPLRSKTSTTWAGVTVCTCGAAAATLSTIVETPAEYTVVAALMVCLGWAYFVYQRGRAQIRFPSFLVSTLSAGFALVALLVLLPRLSDRLQSDSDALIVALLTVLAVLTVISRRRETLLTVACGIAIAGGVLVDWFHLGSWSIGALACLFAASCLWTQSNEVDRIPVHRVDPWIGAASALVLFVAGLFVIDEPVRSFTFGGALVLFAGSLLSSHIQTRERETRVGDLLNLNASIQDWARIDYLTGLPNREALELRLLEEVERAVRYRQPLSIAFVDIDHFKLVNDTLGHQAGDEVLRQTAAVIRATIRTPDFVARYGGEEFLVIAPGTWTEDAIILGNRIQSAITADVDSFLGQPLTVSIGLAGIPEHGTASEEIIQLADQALYMAKANGRNRIEIAGAPGDSPSPG